MFLTTAVRVDQAPATSSKLFYSVDMVPTIQIGEEDYYVAKPIKAVSEPQIAWRRSFSLKEKERLLTLDEDNGCRKQLLRVLKVYFCFISSNPSFALQSRKLLYCYICVTITLYNTCVRKLLVV